MTGETALPAVSRDVADKIYGMLDCLGELFSRQDVPYTIASGTQLGAERHGGLIPWDDDADLYVLAEDAARIARLESELSHVGLGIAPWWFGFKVFVLGGDPWPGQPPTGVTYPAVDVFTLGAIDGRLVLASERARALWPREFLLPGEWEGRQPNAFGDLVLTGLGASARVRYLDELYGRDWRDTVRYVGSHLLEEPLPEQVSSLPTTACAPRRARLFGVARARSGD